jgi:D-beta-D-heptose 7-phosphate kinase/D-beta-D-heptose 1-phosphate adenosyltransferase
MQQQTSLKVLLIGDSCTDVYVYGDCNRLNPEAPTPVLDFSHKKVMQGMAWNVMKNLISFGLSVYILTNDRSKIVKTRYVDKKSNQQILRVDEEVKLDTIEYDIPYDVDAIVISDYNKGFLTEEKIFEIVGKAKCPVFIDSKKNNLPKTGCYIKINENEYSKLIGEYKNLIITRGSRGAEYKNVIYPSQQVNVHDVVGAGDTFLSALVFGYLTKNSIVDAIQLANKASAIAVSNPGTYVLTEEDVNGICN